ncbi:MAG: hydrogenase 4 subunit F [Deltaproteobacteria bacterium]|nr:hydrogenase 4 subunit F [Deltaproteobacteria bacterium]
MDSSLLLWILLALPAACAGISLLPGSPRAVLRFVCAGVLATSAAAFMAVAAVLRGVPVRSPAGWFFLDELSAWHLAVLMMVYSLSSLFAVGYFRQDAAARHFTLRLARRFGALWFGALWSMILVLVSNNLGIMWVGIEATTLLTAFLICIPVSPTSLEAMWKYLIMCSVGVAFAFIGTLLVGAAAAPAQLPPSETLLWTRLQASAGLLDLRLLKAGFLFLMVGYGTKAGLAPMHNWLPDAHSQAPAPVSAVFSGILLNAALYCVLRYVPILESATGHSGWSREILTLFGLVSILVASAFILFQHDAKRMLAYHSVEHLGIITLGMGIGGLGTLAALFHMLNHSLTKTVAFFTAGRLGQIYGSNDMTGMTGALRTSRLWGGGFFVSMLALIGVAPFAIFMSEFQLLRASLGTGSFPAAVLFLVGTAVVFVGALRHVTSVVWGNPSIDVSPVDTSMLDRSIVVVPLAALLILGLWMPSFLWRFIERAAAIVGGGG